MGGRPLASSPAFCRSGGLGTSDLPYPCLKTLPETLTYSDSCGFPISVLRSPGIFICLNQRQLLACPSCTQPLLTQLLVLTQLPPSAQNPFPQPLTRDFLHSPHTLDQRDPYFLPIFKLPASDLPKKSSTEYWLTFHPLTSALNLSFDTVIPHLQWS